MAIRIVADSLDDLPEPLRASAKQEGDLYTVDALGDGWGIDNVQQSKNRQTKLGADLKRQTDRLQKLKRADGSLIEPEEILEALQELEALKANAGKQINEGELRAKVVAEAEAKFAKRLADAEKKLNDMLGKSRQKHSDLVVTAALAESGALPKRVDALRTLLRDRLGFDEQSGDDGIGELRVRAKEGWLTGNGPDGFMPVRDYVSNVVRSEFPEWFAGDGSVGAGAVNSQRNGSGQSQFRFKRSDINGRASEYQAMEARAKAAGQKVQIVD